MHIVAGSANAPSASTVKGTVSRLGFRWHKWMDIGLSKRRAWFFDCSDVPPNLLSHYRISLVYAKREWLHNFLGQVFLLLNCSAGFRIFLRVIDPFFPLAGGLCNLYANDRGKWPIQRQPPFVRRQPQANPFLSLHNYSPLVISGDWQK